jgi:hypothetical protein
MTEPERLLSGSGDDVEVALLRSAEPDAPSGRCVQRTLLALGLGSGITAAASSATAASAAATTASSSVAPAATASSATAAATAGAVAKASIPPAAQAAGTAATGGALTGLFGSVTVKWIGIAGVAGLVTWGAATQLGTGPGPEGAERRSDTTQTQAAQAEDDTPTDAAEPAPVAPPHRPTDAAPPEAVPDAAPEPAPVALPPQQTTKHPVPAAASAPSTRKRKPSLSEEVAALDAARKAMDEDPEKALSELEKYEGYEGGVLAQEAEVLKIEALARAGKKKQAKSAAAAFLAQYPSSPLAPRVRRAVGQ